MHRSQQRRHVKRQVYDAVLYLEIGRVQHIGRAESVGVLLDKLPKRRKRIARAGLDLDRRDVMPVGHPAFGEQGEAKG